MINHDFQLGQSYHKHHPLDLRGSNPASAEGKAVSQAQYFVDYEARESAHLFSPSTGVSAVASERTSRSLSTWAGSSALRLRSPAPGGGAATRAATGLMASAETSQNRASLARERLYACV